MYQLSQREATYIKVIKRLGGSRVRLRALARELGVSAPSALEEVRHLEKKGLLKNKRGFITLTEKGLEAVETLRRTHIAFETLLSSYGVLPKEACVSAHEFDFAIPKSVADRVFQAMGNPSICPEGREEC
jgi:DtxR family Mn-dependent transcriptional regulator